MSAKTEFLFNFDRSGTPREADEPMRILLLGDFSGRALADRAPLANRPTVRVDLDNLDAVVTRFAPRIATPAGDLAISSLDDFHPDALFHKLDLFQKLREARTRPVTPDDGSTLASLLGGNPKQAAAASAGKPGVEGIDALIHRVVAPHIVPDTSAQSKAYLNAVDAGISEQMRVVLHDPAFQGMEAAWRGVQWLVSRIELDENLQLHLLDVSQDELRTDLSSSGESSLEQSATFTALVDRWRGKAGGQRWSALIGLYSFEASDADLSLLAALGAVASNAGGPFVSSANASLWKAGDDASSRTSWDALRTSGAARWLGLVAPRMLLRRPYGARIEPVSAFAFEELGNTPGHEQYLWANGALAFALLLGRAYTRGEGWSFSMADEREVDDLPSCTRLDRDGEKELVPCAETFLNDKEAEQLLENGVMPLISHRHSNVAQLMRSRSIAKPAAALNGIPE